MCGSETVITQDWGKLWQIIQHYTSFWYRSSSFVVQYFPESTTLAVFMFNVGRLNAFVSVVSVLVSQSKYKVKVGDISGATLGSPLFWFKYIVIISLERV